VDGSGRPGFRADVGIRGDRIVRVAPEGIPAENASQIPTRAKLSPGVPVIVTVTAAPESTAMLEAVALDRMRGPRL
jgi:N-acyl-D-aspartate/D-glutamate deacylase